MIPRGANSDIDRTLEASVKGDESHAIVESVISPSQSFSLAAEIIAPVHLDELRDMRDILPALLETFRNDVSHSIYAVQAAVLSKDPQSLAQAAHGITGAAGSVGGQRLAALSRELEQRGRSGVVEGAEVLLPLIDAEYDNLCAALERVSSERQ